MAEEPVAAVPPPGGGPTPQGRLGRLFSGSTGGLLWMVFGSGIGQGIALAVSPLLTRLYTPEEFGLLRAFMSVTAVSGTFVVFRMEAAIPLPKSDRTAASVAWLGIAFGAVGSLAIGLLGPLIAVPIATMVGTPDLGSVWWWVSVATFAIVLDKVLLTWMVREKRYKALAARNFLQGVGQAGSQVGFGYAPFQSVGLLLGWILGRIVAIGGLFSSGGLFAQGFPRRKDLVVAVRRYRRFPLVASWAALLNVLGQQAPFLVIGAYYGSVSLGLMGLTAQVLAAPVTLIGDAVSRVFQGEGSAAIRDGVTPLRPIIRSNVKVLSAISVPMAVVLVFVSPPLFAFVFGAQWREAGVYAQILALGYAANLIVSPMSQTLLILEKQGKQLVWDASRMIVTVGGPLVAAMLGYSATVAIATLSAGFVVCYGALWWTCVRAATRYDQSLVGRGAGTTP
ncbi:MAG: oligosaccharide flippase family protein [Nakamurella sp.]